MRDLAAEVWEFAAKLAWGSNPGVKWLTGVLAAAWAYLAQAEATPVVLCAGALIVLDMLTGVLASWVEKKPIQSRVFGRTISKIIAFGSCLLVLAAIPRFTMHMSGGADAAATYSVILGAAIVGLHEALSVFENCARLDIPIPAEWLNKLRERLGVRRQRKP